jgi:hypothetical protein
LSRKIYPYASDYLNLFNLKKGGYEIKTQDPDNHTGPATGAQTAPEEKEE